MRGFFLSSITNASPDTKLTCTDFTRFHLADGFPFLKMDSEQKASAAKSKYTTCQQECLMIWCGAVHSGCGRFSIF